MNLEQEKADYILRSHIEHWIDLAEKNQHEMLMRSDFESFTQKRQELREQIFNYIKKRDTENDLQKMQNPRL